MLKILILAIIIVESGGDNNAVNGDAVGCMQIRPICVRDVNRILGEKRFTLKDRYSREKSIEMFKIYTSHYYKPGMPEMEARARIWNGGPKGWKKKSTEKYWRKVKNVIDNRR